MSSSASAYDPMAFDPFAHNFYIIDIETEKLERLNEKEFGHLTPDQVNWYMEFGKELEDSIKNEAAAKEAFRKKEEASARRALLLSSGGSSLAAVTSATPGGSFTYVDEDGKPLSCDVETSKWPGKMIRTCLARRLANEEHRMLLLGPTLIADANIVMDRIRQLKHEDISTRLFKESADSFASRDLIPSTSLSPSAERTLAFPLLDLAVCQDPRLLEMFLGYTAWNTSKLALPHFLNVRTTWQSVDAVATASKNFICLSCFCFGKDMLNMTGPISEIIFHEKVN